MQGSIVDVIARQRARVDVLSRLAGRFMDEPAQAALERVAGRLTRLAATLATPNARGAIDAGRLQGFLERLVHHVGLLRIDDPTAVARVAWVVAEIEESIRRPEGAGVGGAVMPVYRAN